MTGVVARRLCRDFGHLCTQSFSIIGTSLEMYPSTNPFLMYYTLSGAGTGIILYHTGTTGQTFAHRQRRAQG